MHRPTKNTNNQGFTLIELMLAVAFVGGLLMTIALIIMQIMGLYNKGLTLKEVDGVSRLVIRDIQQGVAASTAFKLDYPDGTEDHPLPPIVATTLAKATEKEVDYYSNDAGGRLCTGNYSYIWGTGQAIKDATNTLTGKLNTNPTYADPDNHNAPAGGYPVQTMTRHNKDSSTEQVAVRFVKKRDPTKEMCKIPAGETESTTAFDKKIGDEADYENMFGNGDNNLMIYKFSTSTPSFSSFEGGEDVTAVATFYSFSMVIGTQMGDENKDGLVVTNNATCRAPADSTLNDAEYCAVNKVDFVARTGRVAR